LRVSDWQSTRDTLHLWTQVVGKIRMANAPLVNHWWNTTLYVTDRGLSTSLMPYRDGRSFTIEFDFTAHVLRFTVTDGQDASIPLESRPVSVFYEDVMRTLDDLDLATRIWPMPVEIPDAIPFTEDVDHKTYDPDHARRFWEILVQIARVLGDFRALFIGKVSPVHFFWGGFDLAVTRFSGRPAPRYSRAIPNCAPYVMEEAYSHEVSSAGYWPGPDGEGSLYSYTYPEPAGFQDWPVGPSAARYDDDFAQFLLPYEAVRNAPDPDAALMEFLQTTYEAGAESAGWDRAALERSYSASGVD